jgi:hypothetical protein
MNTINKYIEKTESAVLNLFNGIDSYLAILHEEPFPIFSGVFKDETSYRKNAEIWYKQNENSIRESLQFQEQFAAESFALSTLCGALLQIAFMAFQLFSKNQNVPKEFKHVIKTEHKPVLFCIGRLVRKVPLGLLVYAGRNQHNHMNDETLREPNLTIFEMLSKNIEVKSNEDLIDPAFDLKNTKILSFSANIAALLGWRQYEFYKADLLDALGKNSRP